MPEPNDGKLSCSVLRGLTLPNIKIKNDNMTEYEKLLKDFRELDFPKSKNPTFLEILSKRDAETLWSRFLSFYLNPNNEHGLSDFVLKSFLQVCNLKFVYKKENIK